MNTSLAEISFHKNLCEVENFGIPYEVLDWSFPVTIPSYTGHNVLQDIIQNAVQNIVNAANIPQQPFPSLEELYQEAEEQELKKPDKKAIENAKTLLPELYAIYPADYCISPTERCGISLAPPWKYRRAVSIECTPDGAVYCFVTMSGKKRRAKFYQMDGLPDTFIKEALRDLARN